MSDESAALYQLVPSNYPYPGFVVTEAQRLRFRRSLALASALFEEPVLTANVRTHAQVIYNMRELLPADGD